MTLNTGTGGVFTETITLFGTGTATRSASAGKLVRRYCRLRSAANTSSLS